MTEQIIDSEALGRYLPHRGVNLLPDRVTIDVDRGTAVSIARVMPDDPRGRGIMGRCDGQGRPSWYEPFLGELMALTGVPLLHHLLAPKGQTAAFSMVSRISNPRLAPLGEEVTGYATITRSRSDFTVFATRAECQGQTILEAEVMSGAIRLEDIAGTALRPFPGPLPGTPIDGASFAWKRPELRFIDRLVSAVPAASGGGTAVCAYTYPADHPFVPGHFPGSAVMMGMCQWAAVADAAWLARTTFGIAGGVLVQAAIRRPDGAEVLDVRDLVLEVDQGLPRIASTKRLAFRDVVRPGDGILIEVAVAPR